MTPAMTDEELLAVAEEANLAPSAHNTQPVRWQRDGTGRLTLTLAPARLLPVGDPEGRDARLSGGGALQGTIWALARRGLGIKGWETHGDSLQLEIGGDPQHAPDRAVLDKRTTYRAGFAPSDEGHRQVLAAICRERTDVTSTTGTSQVAELAELNDSASLGFMRRTAFRQELYSWMRFSNNDPRWRHDGLSAEALAMSGPEALAARLILRRPLFEILDLLGATGAIVSERAKTLTATALVAFHRPANEDHWTSGMHLYTFWTTLTEGGFAAWPMSALADDPDTNRHASDLFHLPPGETLINVLRVGPHPGTRQPARARLPGKDLIITA